MAMRNMSEWCACLLIASGRCPQHALISFGIPWRTFVNVLRYSIRHAGVRSARHQRKDRQNILTRPVSKNTMWFTFQTYSELYWV